MRKLIESFLKANWILLSDRRKKIVIKNNKNVHRWIVVVDDTLHACSDDDNVSSLNMIWELFNIHRAYNESHHATVNLHELL